MSLAVLQRATLVLNRNWQPVNLTPVSRAISLVYSEQAVVIDACDYRQFEWNDWAALEALDGEPCIVGSRKRYRAPEIISLLGYDRLPRVSVAFSRRNIFRRDRFTCQYCGVQPRREELTLEHVIPRSLGGTTTWRNCVLACFSCNARKGNRTPDQAGMRLLRLPIKPTWHACFAAENRPLASWAKFLSEAYWNAELEP